MYSMSIYPVLTKTIFFSFFVIFALGNGPVCIVYYTRLLSVFACPYFYICAGIILSIYLYVRATIFNKRRLIEIDSERRCCRFTNGTLTVFASTQMFYSCILLSFCFRKSLSIQALFSTDFDGIIMVHASINR